MKNRAGVFLAVLLTVAAAGLVFVLARGSRGERDGDFGYRLLRLRQIDAQLDEEALAVRQGLVPHFDRVAQLARLMREAEADVAHSPIASARAASPEIERDLHALDAAVDAKFEATLRFLARTGTLNNSIRYLPRAIAEATGTGAVAVDDATRSAFNDLLTEVLIYSVRTDAQTHERVTSLLQSAAAARATLGPEASGLDVALAHARFVLEHKPEADRSLATLLEVHPEHAINQLFRDYTTRTEAEIRRGRSYRGALFALSAIVLLVIAEAMRRLQRNAISLEAEVAERTRAEREMRAARDAAEKAARVKGEFLANMSHEIRTPMNGVIGMTGLLLETELNSEQREYADTIRSSGEALLRIIDDVLDFSKIEAEKIELDPVPFEVGPLLDGVIGLFAARAKDKSIDLLLRDRTPRGVTFVADAVRLRQVLLNLVGNAVKFTDKGHVLLQASTAEETERDTVVTIEVHDTGIGIPAEKLETIFEQFAQGDGSTTRRHGGTGLGLTISRRLIQLMGGAITVESKRGEGSRFRIVLRLAKGGESARQTPAPPLDVAVLVIDKPSERRAVLEEQLGSWGMRSIAVDSGSEARKAIASARIDGRPVGIVLVDEEIVAAEPELARTLRHTVEQDQVSVVLLCPVGGKPSAESLAAQGFDAALMKPIRSSQLLDALASLRDAQKGGERRTSAVETHRRAPAVATDPTSRILVAEDNVVNQKVAVRILQSLGFACDVARDGREAVDMVKQTHYALVFMDCQMPELDGYDATAEIRKWEGLRQHVTIVAMTANAMQGDRERCVEAGMDDYVAKPVRPESIRAVLERWVTLPQASPSVENASAVAERGASS